jgi:hypothetical protein
MKLQKKTLFVLFLGGFLLASTGLLAGAGCAAPTLPLPPPSALVEAPDASGMVTVTGEVTPGAFVGCLNERTERGIIVRSDPDSGAYSLRIEAEVGDDLGLWQIVGSDRGPTVYRQVPAPR